MFITRKYIPRRTVLKAADFRIAQTTRAALVVGGDNDTPSLLTDACKDAQLLVHESQDPAMLNDPPTPQNDLSTSVEKGTE